MGADLARKLIQCLEPLKVEVLPGHTAHLRKHADVLSTQRHNNAGRNDHHIHMTYAVRTADKIDRTLHATDLGTRHKHTLTDVDGAFKDIIDVDSCCFIYHNEHSYSRLRSLCHVFS